MLPPERASFNWKFMTPAMASEPYCADAPSRSTSACRIAMEGMTEMSGPCEPSATPLPSHVMTAARWRRLPFTRISVWSGARLRRFTGRTIVAASLIGWVATLNDGTMVRNWFVRSESPCAAKSRVGITSTGTVDSVTERGRARLPTTTTCSSSPTSISTSSMAAPASTSTICAGALKPASSNVTSQVPGARPLKAYRPVPSVKVTCTSPSASRAVTATPGSTSPVASVTVPEISPSCAAAAPGASTAPASASASAMGVRL